MSRVCCIANCNSGISIYNRTLFKISDEKHQNWLDAIKPHLRRGRSSRKHFYICDLHFKDEDIDRYFTTTLSDGSISKMERLKLKLKPTSVPCIFNNKEDQINECAVEMADLVNLKSTAGAIFENEVCDEVVTYDIESLKSDLKTMDPSNIPKHWLYCEVPLGLLFIYFGDFFTHSTRSILVKLDMTVEIRAGGNIANIDLASIVSCNGDILSLMTTVSELNICRGSDDVTPCVRGFFKATSIRIRDRCRTCSIERKRKLDRDMKQSKRDESRKNLQTLEYREPFKMTATNCCVPGCDVSQTSFPVRTFYELPSNRTKCEKWLFCIKREDLIDDPEAFPKKYVVCSDHFSEEQYCGNEDLMLRKTAIPDIVPVDRSTFGNEYVAEPFEQSTEEIKVFKTIEPKLCRVCGRSKSSLVPIFEDLSVISSHSVPLYKMLEMYLPLQIHTNDLLPLNICDNCLDILDQWHTFYITCIAADRAFKNICFGETYETDGACESQPTDSRFGNDCEETEIGEKNSFISEFPPDSCRNEEESEVNVNNLPAEEALILEESICQEYTKSLCVGNTLKTSENAETVNTVDRQTFTCKYCSESFQNKTGFKDHYKLCEESPTVCDICGRIIAHRKRLAHHRYRYHSNREYMCDKCGKCVPLFSFAHHISSVHPEAQYCDLCCKILRSKRIYDDHMRKHLLGQLKASFKIEPVLQHDVYSVYQCPACYQTFSDKSSTIKHLNESKLLKCSTCGLKFKNEKRLVLHSCKKLICQYCGKMFYNTALWKSHERIHTGEKPYKCIFCSSTFRTYQLRTQHHKTHRAPSYECKYCYKKFKYAPSLRNHLKIHVAEQLCCLLCNSKFSDYFSLQEHIAVHSII